MSRTVQCRKYKKEMDGLDVPPLPGPKGAEIYETVSRQAWQEWLEHQKMLINEKQLSLMDMEARTYLGEQRDKFLSGDNYDAAEGYVAPKE
ncbi:Fe-S cluster biosynthesis and repair protein YggX [Alteromonadaceae bacterium Bs31]|nr:Fe-S cluster biosynthesis and repair protein YggX [Alteromonadaceae bacterium Bs31]